jgi:murein DD-endopeptidase MepM/ murein hydrolase activator NlpD
MARRFLVLLMVGLALGAAPLRADDGYGKQQAALDAKLAAEQAKIAQARARESRLNTQIGSLNKQISSLETRVGNIASRMSALQTDLTLRRRRLGVLNALYGVQTSRVNDLRREYRLAVNRLDKVLVTIYQSPQPGVIDLLVQAKSFQDVIDGITYLSRISKQDQAVATEVASAKHRVTVARRKTAEVRQRVANDANLINARLEQVAVIHNELLTSRAAVSHVRTNKTLALMLARTQEQAAIRESAAIQSASAQIEAKIRAAAQPSANSATGSSTPPATTTAAAPSAAGLIWPVSGPITSPFGPRWGGFHPGIDIGVPTGTPIHAAAAGTVIWCGWESGYGNLVVIDHHNGIATAYAHQSQIAASCNEDVSQGQVIGYVGCTGFCTGPHLHFEVRVNGSPVDPLGYLP